jgi:hypothetical protein
VVSVALPPFTGLVPNTVAPSLKVTEPLGVPEIAAFTMAVKVTLCPNLEGLTEEVSDVEVVACNTSCATVDELLASKKKSPE